ncbi:MAG: hypothetical protein JXR07_14290 [Reichenbachiella sp.]
MPEFETFAQGFEGGNSFNIQLDDPYETLAFNPVYEYLGFHVQFMFQPTFFKTVEANQRNLFSIAFESGQSTSDYYQMKLDSQYYEYGYTSGVFGLTLGYRRLLTKKDKKIKFFVGIEWTHEFQISPTVREIQMDESFGEEISNRKFFDANKYNFYLMPNIGLDWQFLKRLSLFYQFQIGYGHQNGASINVNDLFIGGKFGLAFRL